MRNGLLGAVSRVLRALLEAVGCLLRRGGPAASGRGRAHYGAERVLAPGELRGDIVEVCTLPAEGGA